MRTKLLHNDAESMRVAALAMSSADNTTEFKKYIADTF
jgi:hypothetical protein